MAHPKGGLYVPTSASWFAVPAGKHDDQVDALGLVGQLLDRMVPGRVPPEKPKEPPEMRRYRPIEDLDDLRSDWRML